MKALPPIARRTLVLATCTVIILLPAIFNRYPLVFSDTGTYLRSAFEGYVPVDRPYWYGPFMRFTSANGTSLWGIAIAQALLCVVYLVRIVAWVCPSGNAGRTALIASVVLTVGTSLGWYAGFLIPDIFTGIGIASMYLLLRGPAAAWIKCLDVLVIAAACWMHLSNLIILPLSGAVLLVIGRRSASIPLRRSLAWYLPAVLFGWGGLAAANRMLDGKAYISQAGHVFFVSRMIDLGMLKPYLDEHCPEEQLGLCAYKDSLPERGEAFLWWTESPVAKQGGWLATKAEYDRIVRGSFTEPRFLWWHVRGSLASTAEQLAAWEVGQGFRSGWYRHPASPPYVSIARLLPRELGPYLNPRQNSGDGLDMRWPDRLYRLVLALALVAGAWALLRGRRDAQHAEARCWVFFAFLAIVIGAWTCSSLSMVDARYLGRDSWLLPFAVLLLLLPWRERASAKLLAADA